VSATSSVQSHGGARTVDCRPQLLRPVPPDPNTDAVDRLPASPVGAPLLSRQSGRSCTEHLGPRHCRMAPSPPPSVGARSWENDSHAL
jgi:hypothetical protein